MENSFPFFFFTMLFRTQSRRGYFSRLIATRPSVFALWEEENRTGSVILLANKNDKSLWLKEEEKRNDDPPILCDSRKDCRSEKIERDVAR